jgi:Tol biopolymer transport system component
MDLETGRILDRFPIAPGPERLCVAWVRDGSGLIVVRHHDGVDNLWLQPLGGGTPRQLTSFRSLEIRAFNILSDGKTFVFSRGKDESDVLMFDEVLSAD